MGAAGGAAGAAAASAAAIAQAIKASGAIVSVDANNFQTIVDRSEAPLVVCATSGLFSTKYDYLTGYRELIFFTRSTTPLSLKPRAEVVEAKRIWIPA